MLETNLQTAQAITLGNCVSSFVEDELLSLSPETIKWYRARLKLFALAVGESREIDKVSLKDLIAWYKALEARTLDEPPTLSVDTFHGYVRVVRRFYKWLYDQKLVINEDWRKLKLPKIPEQVRKGIDDHNVLQLMDTAQTQSPRDYAIFTFMESTAARRGGVASLKLDDLNINAPEPHCRRVTVHEKGRKARTAFLSSDALDAMRAWLKVRRSKTNYVFVDERPGRDRGLKPGAISQVVRRYKESLKLAGRCSPHQWRHRRARCLLIDGMPLNLVSQVLGHSTVVVTAKFYGNLLVDELQNAYDQHYKPPKSV